MGRLVLAAVLACNPRQQPQPVLAEPSPGPGLTLAAPPDAATTAQFLDDFRANDLAAMAKYNGHDFRITGVIDEVRVAQIANQTARFFKGVSTLHRLSWATGAAPLGQHCESLVHGSFLKGFG